MTRIENLLSKIQRIKEREEQRYKAFLKWVNVTLFPLKEAA